MKKFLPEIDENALSEAMKNVDDKTENPFAGNQDFVVDLSPEPEPAHPQYTDPLLIERETTHGDYRNTARIIQRLKDTILVEQVRRTKRGQPRLTDTQKECLDMIVHKIGRIISGESGHPDHWADIAGYAKLARADV